MIKIPSDEIIGKIGQQTGLSKADIDSKIEKKMEQLSGLISREGAAHIIANEMGVKLLDAGPSGAMQIKSIMPGMKSVETVGKVQQVYEVRNFNSKGREGKVGSFLMGDETGNIRVVLWNDQVTNMQSLKEGHVVKLIDAYSKDNNGRKELHINDRSKFVVNPLGIIVNALGVGQRPAALEKILGTLRTMMKMWRYLAQ